MKIACHQPYAFPYKGYFDLIKVVDMFIIYDDSKYMKGKYINRNYFPDLFTFRLQKHHDHAFINECYFKDIEVDKKVFIKKTGLHVEKYLEPMRQEYNVALNNALTLATVCEWMDIHTPFVFASELKHRKGIDGLLDMIKALDGDTYINLPGGKALYNQEMFGDIKLEFLETEPGPSILCYLDERNI